MVLLLLSLVGPPLVLVVQASLTDDITGGLTTAHYRALAATHGLAASIANSLSFSALSAIIAIALGGTNAWIVARTDSPLKSLTLVATIFSLAIPYVLYVSAWLQVLGRAGPVNQAYRTLSGSDGEILDVYSLPGMVLIEGLLWSPFVFLAFGTALTTMNPEFEEAARMSGGRGLSVFKRVTLGLFAPSLLALALLLFVRAIEAFEVPALVGLPGRIVTMTTDIYSAMQQSVPPDLGTASAFSVALIAIILVLVGLHDRAVRNADRFATVTGKGFRPRPIRLGRWRPLAAALLLANFTLLVALPLAMLIWQSLLPFAQAVSIGALRSLTLEHYAAILANPDYATLIGNTVLVAGVSATFAILVTALAAWLIVRRAPAAPFINQMCNLPLVLPGLVLGVGVMQLFLRLPLPVYGTVWILVWAFVIAYLPYGLRATFSGLVQIHHELEEASFVSGGRPLATLARVTLPLLVPSLAAGWLFIFLVSARVLSLAILLSGPASQTLAVAMFDLWANGQGGELAALGLMWAAAVSAIVAVGYLVSGRLNSTLFGMS